MTSESPGQAEIPESGRDIVVVGASAGGVEALKVLVGHLPADLPAAVFVVLHLSKASPGALPAILSRAGPLPALTPSDGDRIAPGRVYVAPPDHHMLLEDGLVRLTLGPTENGHRPAVDPLFRSAARTVGPRAAGVILSGVLDDGSAGLAVVKAHGGLAIVQDPDEALYPAMPMHAMQTVRVDHVLPVAEIASLIDRLSRAPLSAAGRLGSPPPDAPDHVLGLHDVPGNHPPGPASGFTCPDCAGALWEITAGGLTRFRCRVGHAWSADSLLAQQSGRLETALWVALRALEEKADLARKMASRARKHGHERSATRFDRQAQDAALRAEAIRVALFSDRPAVTDAATTGAE